MMKVYWVCLLCGEAGWIMVQFAGSTPLDPNDGDMQRARALALPRITHEHTNQIHIKGT